MAQNWLNSIKFADRLQLGIRIQISSQANCTVKLLIRVGQVKTLPKYCFVWAETRWRAVKSIANYNPVHVWPQNRSKAFKIIGNTTVHGHLRLTTIRGWSFAKRALTDRLMFYRGYGDISIDWMWFFCKFIYSNALCIQWQCNPAHIWSWKLRCVHEPVKMFLYWLHCQSKLVQSASYSWNTFKVKTLAERLETIWTSSGEGGKKRGEEEDRREGDDVDNIQPIIVLWRFVLNEGIWGFKSWRICFKPGDLFWWGI